MLGSLQDGFESNFEIGLSHTHNKEPHRFQAAVVYNESIKQEQKGYWGWISGEMQLQRSADEMLWGVNQ